MYATNVADKDYLQRFGFTLTAVMDFRGVKPADVSRLTGANRETVYRWMGGKHAPETDLMIALALRLDIPGDLLLRPLSARGPVLATMGAWDKMRASQSDGLPYPWLPE